MAVRVGQQIGPYRLLRLLGRGGFAEVYLGEHAHLGTQAAVKVLSTKLSAEELDHFREEARTIGRLQHPHIVRVLDFGVERGVPFLVMEYAPSGTLRQRHPKGTRLTPETALPYVQQMASALQYAHEQRLIHRDVKPENMLVGEHGEILLSDFGIALVAQSSRYQSTQEVAGTLAYMAPEQIQGHPRLASDQYALGIVVYEWLAGERPFSGGMSEVVAGHLGASPPPLREKQPGLSPAIEQVVLTALAKDPHERFASMRAFGRAFEQALSMPELPLGAALPLNLPSPNPGAASSTMPTFTPGTTIPAPPPVTMRLTTPAQPWMEMPTIAAAPVMSSPPSATAPAAPPRRRKHRAAWVLTVLVIVAALLASGGLIWRVSGGNWSTSTAGTITEFPIVGVGTVTLGAITAGPDGNLWFLEVARNRIGSITPAGEINDFPATTLSSAPMSITAGPDGNLWFTEVANNRIGNCTPAAALTEFILPETGSAPEGITASPDGTLWFTERDGNRIGRVTPGGQITEFPVTTSSSAPMSITAGPDGNLWFTENGGNRIGRMTPAGHVTEFPLSTPASGPVSITAGPDGNLWFTESIGQIGRITPGGKITEFRIPTAQGYPYGIAAGPDGNLWFTERDGNRIGRITPTGKVTEFPVPTPESTPWSITKGPDGNLWFTESESNKIGRITPGA